jgi:hypothetical protein
VSTTQIWYTPPGNTLTARFDVTGSNVANVALTEVFSPAFAAGVNTYHTRNTNNYYEWICGNPDVAFANISMINWTPSVGNLTLVDYTFPNGGGTLSSTTSNIAIAGQWSIARESITKASSAGDAFYRFGLTSSPAYSGGDLVRKNQSGAPGTAPVWDNSPIIYQNSAIQTYSITANTDTFANTRFYANVKNQLANAAAAGSTTQANVSIAFEYTYTRSFEVNLHSTSTNISSDVDFASLGGILHSAASELVIDIDFEPQAQNLTGFRFVDRGDGVHEGTLDGEIYVAADYADLDYFVQSGVSVSFTPDRPLLQQYSEDATLESVTPSVLVGISMENSVDATFTVLGGRQQPIAADITIDAVLDDVVPGLLPGGTVQATIQVDSATTATNRVFTFALDYIDPDYTDTGYFEQFSTATDTFVTEIDCAVLADSSIVRSDGSIALAADLATTVVAGFQVSGGVILAGAAEFEIAPYITGGTGVIRSAAATLTDDFVVPDLFLGQAVELQATLAIESTAAGFASITRGIQDQLEIALELSAQAIAAPPILGVVDLVIDLEADAVPSLTSGFASPSRLETGPSTLTGFAGYTVFGQFAVTQGITADFVVAGSTFRIDDYFAAQVRPETRRIAIPAATGQIQVGPETRVNTIQVETRGLVVEPETRRDRIAINPATLEGNRLRRYNQ